MSQPILTILLIVVGLGAGILSGFVGIGGGIIIVPALVYLLNMSQHQAQGTTLALLMMPVGFLAVFNYYKSGFVDIKAALIIAVGFVLGGFFGSKMALTLSPELVKKIFGGLMLLIALKLILSK